MKAVIISTYYNYGGAEIQALLEKKYLESSGYHALLLTFDPNIQNTEDKNHINIARSKSGIIKRLNDVFINPILIKKIRKIIKEYNPDFIHMHNVTFAYKSILDATKEYYTIQTIHDYTWLCDNNGWCLWPDLTPCRDMNPKNCWKHCSGSGSIQKIRYLYRCLLRASIHKYRIKNVDCFISPSKMLKYYATKNGYKTVHIPNAIEIKTNIRSNQRIVGENDVQNSINSFGNEQARKRTVLCYGRMDEGKGIFRLLEVLKDNSFPKLKFEFIGPIANDIDKEALVDEIQRCGAHYCQQIPHEEIMKKAIDAFAIIIPSLYMENYPNAAIEGYLTGCLVSGSNRGGIKELVVDDNLLFNVLSNDEIKDCLHYLENINNVEAERIRRLQMDRYNENNVPKIFVDNIIRLVNSREYFKD
ncbi:glycosyltransferase [Oribacterium sp. WCC10]|uniref:glycosyltransferase n=1 Tax=Oribacterium sp. WCC10 TaxID=1855343 RepID=UPI0008E025EE|nr:glycosyltransferase [Oribacterium sp. WCC10]SFG80556.1 Glycosyltransferase involved in cell wall bisynthesis [Oribacterium sp. WCC10]